MSTIKDVAKASGLAPSTISKYLNGGHLLPDNRRKIETAIRKLDFTVNEFARGLKTNKSGAVGIIVPDIGNIYVAQTVPTIVDELKKHGYAAIICDARGSHEREIDLVKFLLTKRIDGLINMLVGNEGDHLQRAIACNVPVVLFDRHATDCVETVDCVATDNVRSAQEAVTHLLEKGHRRIGVIAGPQNIMTARERLSGYRLALAQYGLTADDSLIGSCDFTSAGSYRTCKQLLRHSPDMTALFTTSYDLTIGAMMALNELGVKIPDTLSIFAYDDMPFAQAITPRLSFVAQPTAETGLRVAHRLIARMNGTITGPAQTIVLPAKLILRDSVYALDS